MVPIIATAIAGVLGNAAGKIVGKIMDRIPSESEGRRNRIEALKKERDELLKQKETIRSHTRIQYIMSKLSVLEKGAINES